MKPWQLGNTSVRSGTRLRDGLEALAASGLEGDIRGQAGDKAWREALGAHGVVVLGEDDTQSVGRKWRSALGKLGFIYDEYGTIQAQVGDLDCITPNGNRLMAAQSLPAQQECYLRAVAGLWIDPNTNRPFGTFSPLLHTLAVMKELDSQTGSSALSMSEFCFFVNSTNNSIAAKQIATEIANYRLKRGRSANKRQYDKQCLDKVAAASGLASSTHIDYADMNLRYLKATGLFQSKGRGIELRSLNRVLIDGLLTTLVAPGTAEQYWKNITDGVALPTDQEADARAALDVVVTEAKSRGISVAAPSSNAVVDLTVARFETEQAIALDNEARFALDQRNMPDDILRFMELLQKRSMATDDPFSNAERPAYLEWTIWRAFLAINSLLNAPSESRRFNVDHQTLPTGTAPGGGPDLIFEFDDFVLVVEVTLLTSFRQETAEGTSVREHTYRETVRRQDKPVYCLFIAPEMFIQTLDTFRQAQWWGQDGTRADLEIVPLTIKQFQSLFDAMFAAGKATPNVVRDVILRGRELADQHANPTNWQQAIDELLEETLVAIRS